MTSMKRRENGAGSVKKRADGRWEGALMVGTKPDGRPDMRYVYGKTEAEVFKKLRELREKRNHLPPSKVGKMSFEEYSLRWLELYKKPVLKPTSFDRLEGTLKNNIYPYIGMMQMGEITSDDIQRLINYLTSNGGKDDNGLSYSSLKKIYEAINGCMKHAYDKGDLPRNPVLGVKLPSKKAIEQLEADDIKFMTSEQVDIYCKEALRKHGNGHPVYRLGAGLVFILATGLRSGEARALKWSDIDDKYVAVSRSIVTVKSRSEELASYIHKEQNSLKSESGYRKILINKRANQALEELRVVNGDREYIYATKSGKIIGGRNLYRTNSDICKAVGISDIDVHALRHTFASMLFAKGKPVEYVSALLGHSDVAITQKIYIHLIPENIDAVAESIDF